MDLFGCTVALGGDSRNTVVFDGHTPKTLPELEVLQKIHGLDSVYNVEKVGEQDDVEPTEERARLMDKYGGELVMELYPGLRPNMEFALAPAPKKKAPAKKRTPKKPVAEPVIEPEEIEEEINAADEEL